MPDHSTDVLELLAAGASREEILQDLPYLEPEDIVAVRSEDVEGRPEATGRDHLDPGGSSRATGIKPVD